MDGIYKGIDYRPTFDRERACRACLRISDENMLSIHSLAFLMPNANTFSVDLATGIDCLSNQNTEQVLIVTMIDECCGKRIGSEGARLPNGICEKCLHDLQTAYAFKKRCEHAFEQLTKILLYENDLNTKLAAHSSSKDQLPQANNLLTLALQIDSIKYFKSVEQNLLVTHSEEIDLLDDTSKFTILPLETRDFAETDEENKNAVNISDQLVENCCNEIACLGLTDSLCLEELPSKIISNIDELSHQIKSEEATTRSSSRPKRLASMRLKKLANNNRSNKKQTKLKRAADKCESSILTKSTSELKQTNRTLPSNKCSECDRSFSRATHLKRHMTIHTDERAFSCDKCDKSFRRADHLRIHQNHHSQVKPFACEHCNRAFTRAEHLRRHIYARHTDRPMPPAKEFPCEICNRKFTTAKYLGVHQKSHRKRTFDCKLCDEKFMTKDELIEHTKTHTNERPFLCSECGLRFVRHDYLVIHMRRHNNEKPYKCKYCGKGFPRATDLTVHERYHTGEKRHLCTICGKGFQRAYNLLVHIRVHTGERPYQCSHCSKCFAQGNDLKAHVRRHTGERYKCDICGDGFIQGYHLTQHKRNVHGIDMKSHIRRVAKIMPMKDSSGKSTASITSFPNEMITKIEKCEQEFQPLQAVGSCTSRSMAILANSIALHDRVNADAGQTLHLISTNYSQPPSEY